MHLKKCSRVLDEKRELSRRAARIIIVKGLQTEPATRHRKSVARPGFRLGGLHYRDATAQMHFSSYYVDNYYLVSSGNFNCA